MTQPAQHSQYHADPALTALAAVRANNTFMSRTLATAILSNVLSARIRTYGDEMRIGSGGPPGDGSTAALILEGLTSFGGDYHPVGNSVGTLSFDLQEFGFQSFVAGISQEEERNSFGGNLLQVHGTRVTNQLNKSHAVRHESVMMSTAIYTNNAAATATYDGGGSPDFLADVEAGKNSLKQTGGVADPDILMVIPPLTFQALKALAEITDLLSGHDVRAAQKGQDQVWIEVIRQYAGVGRVVVPFAVENTAKEGLATSGGYIWNTDNIFMGLIPAANDSTSALMEIRYSAAGFSDGRKMFRFPNEARTGETVRFGEIVDLLARAEYAYIVSNTLA